MYEERELTDVRGTNRLLARITIAKIEDMGRLLKSLRETPVVQDHPDFRCRTWMADALRRIANAERSSIVGTAELDWGKIERKSRRYVKEKLAAGRYVEREDLLGPKPTWDMIEQRKLSNKSILLFKGLPTTFV